MYGLCRSHTLAVNSFCCSFALCMRMSSETEEINTLFVGLPDSSTLISPKKALRF